MGVATFASAGNYPISLLWFQGGGGAACEVYAAPGSYTSFTTSPPWELVGDTADGGLAVSSPYTYVASPFTVAVTPETTNNPSPAISGTVSDPAASVAVRVNGNWYAVANDNGAWTLPTGDIPVLPNGIYDVVVRGVNTAGQVAFDSTLNELTINTVAPTVTLQRVAAQNGAISSLGITFSEPVSGFSVQDLQLTLSGTSLPLDGTTLTSSDDQHWTLGNLSGLTGTSGTYSLTVSDADWGVTDAAGNVLSTSATTAWIAGPTVAAPAIATPNAIAGSTTSLSVLGADIATGEGSLMYRWAATALPSGAAAPMFSDNGTNTAKNTTVTFSMAGTYGFTVTITDPDGLSTTSSVSVTVNQTLTRISNSGQPPAATAKARPVRQSACQSAGIRRGLGCDYGSAGAEPAIWPCCPPPTAH